MSNKIEQIASEKNETANNQIEKPQVNNRRFQSIKLIYTPHINTSFKAYIKNIPTPSLFTPIAKYTAQKSTMYQLENTNRDGM